MTEGNLLRPKSPEGGGVHHLSSLPLSGEAEDPLDRKHECYSSSAGASFQIPSRGRSGCRVAPCRRERHSCHSGVRAGCPGRLGKADGRAVELCRRSAVDMDRQRRPTGCATTGIAVSHGSPGRLMDHRQGVQVLDAQRRQFRVRISGSKHVQHSIPGEGRKLRLPVQAFPRQDARAYHPDLRSPGKQDQ